MVSDRECQKKAHLRAAVTHERAAIQHQRRAAALAEQGRAQLAEVEGHLMVKELDAAEKERRKADKIYVPSGHSPEPSPEEPERPEQA